MSCECNVNYVLKDGQYVCPKCGAVGFRELPDYPELLEQNRDLQHRLVRAEQENSRLNKELKELIETLR